MRRKGGIHNPGRLLPCVGFALGAAMAGEPAKPRTLNIASKARCLLSLHPGAVVVALLLVTLSGCFGDPAPAPEPTMATPVGTAVLATDLGPGTYQLDVMDLASVHVRALSSSANVTLDSRTSRLWTGTLTGTDAETSQRVGSSGYDWLALDVHDGNVSVLETDGTAIHATPVPLHRERIVLVDYPDWRVPNLGLGLGPGAAIEDAVTLDLGFVPTRLNLLATGDTMDTQVDVVGDRGLVASWGPANTDGDLLYPIVPRTMEPLPRTTFARENATSGSFEVTIRAEALQGQLLLDVAGPSWATPEQVGQAWGEPGEFWPFVFDSLDKLRPVAFQVPSAAAKILVGDALKIDIDIGHLPDFPPGVPDVSFDTGPGVVALWGPGNDYLGLVHHDGAQTVAVPVREAGEHVAVLLRGEAMLGVDQLPSDLSVRELEVRHFYESPTPSGGLGTYDRYEGMAGERYNAWGVPFTVVVDREYTFGTTFVPSLGCGDSSIIIQDMERDNATIAAMSDNWGQDAWHNANFLLSGGPLRILADDFGDTSGCRFVAQFGTFTR